MAKHLIVEGLVQGVGFRAWFQQQARALGLRGWVRNRRDGTVEAAVAGAPEAVERMVLTARQGPTAAQVTRVTLADLDDRDIPQQDFAVHATE